MTSSMWPRLMPNMCGRVRRKPKFTPDASSIMLLGPGVAEETKAKSMKAESSSTVMRASLSFASA